MLRSPVLSKVRIFTGMRFMTRSDTDQARGDASRNDSSRESGHSGGHVGRRAVELAPERVFMAIWAASCLQGVLLIVLWVLNVP